MRIIICNSEAEFNAPGPLDVSTIQPPPVWLQVPEGAALPSIGEVYTQWNGQSARSFHVLGVNIWRPFYLYTAEPQCRILALEITQVGV